MISTNDYLQFFEIRYLNDFLQQDGATVKFCVGEDDSVEELLAKLHNSASTSRYWVSQVTARDTRVQSFDQIFFSVAKDIPWLTLARALLAQACSSIGMPFPAEHPRFSLAELAEHYEMNVNELRRDLNKALQGSIFHQYDMVQEFRIAMLRLCQFEFQTGQVTEAEAESIQDWLTGNLKQISLLRSATIFRRITKTNARAMLFSLVYWLKMNGYSGLLFLLDLRQLFAQPSSTSALIEQKYSRSAIIDTYESLRQLIDNADEFRGMGTIVVLPTNFLEDRTRGIDLYQALKLRIYDEVRDKTRDNPFGSLIRLQSSGQQLVPEEPISASGAIGEIYA